MSERGYMVAGVIHEIAVEIRKVMSEKDKLKAAGEWRRAGSPELSEILHELAVEFRKAMKKAEESKQSATSS